MARLAIKGHPERGEEVVKLLKMLGGHESGYPSNAKSGYWVLDGCLNIEAYSEIPEHLINDFKIFTLEEFLEKFPYKTGDRVIVKGTECFIEDLIWHDELNCVHYKIFHKVESFINGWYSVQSLQPYKKETTEETKEDLCVYDKLDFEQEPCADKVELVLGNNYEVIVKDGKTYVVRKKPQYPKTYEECCNILRLDNNSIKVQLHCVEHGEGELYSNFIKLRRCRNAYWKIANDWKPDWEDDTTKYNILAYKNHISVDISIHANKILVFPTKEIRDAFFENFKELIEECKELL